MLIFLKICNSINFCISSTPNHSRTDGKDMWREGYYVKELINTYLSSVKKAEEQDHSEIPKWPSWEMNNHEQVVEGKLP